MRRGTTVLTPFPFTDLSGAKVRPAVVVSPSDRPGEDVILAFISSVKPEGLLLTDLSIETSHPDFTGTGLKVDSIVKCDKLATVHRRIILGELGALSSALLIEPGARLRMALGL
ncbi:MAG: type II toxin-antitoxin system PemK/MazF family toxin [Candidatus Rokubacteria bacterium]|nr:type II toxin-antitoxin system PemK/MazF family toxin [Candidatus Rokubacteria bacterium]